MKTAILIDTGANVLENKHENVYWIPISLLITKDNKEIDCEDVKDVSQQQLHDLMINKTPIKTSLPPPGKVISYIENLFESYDRVIVLTLSSGISSYFKSLDLIKNEFKDKNLVCIDSRSVSMGILWIVDQLNELLKTNPMISDSELESFVAELTKRIVGGVIVSDLNQLIAGGRIKRFKAAIAKMLKLKLIIRWNGELEFMDKTSSLNTAIDKLLDIINDANQYKTKGIERITILTDFTEETQINELRSTIEQKTNSKVAISYLPGCIYAHVGPKNFAILIEAKA
ncbi:DegV family protein [Ureaplasma diversum]|uniref:DegV family protein n=1 Tax=Ureaplasma diversum NCTC 246 TaxID=1188241 RepID=A0A084EZ88_9BACT|nr:DegV family protein [Ureaplasma diversum]KEZ23280.1 Hypothetical protein, putative DegV family protein [Ureaplasma diversum NCTC 246]